MDKSSAIAQMGRIVDSNKKFKRQIHQRAEPEYEVNTKDLKEDLELLIDKIYKNK